MYDLRESKIVNLDSADCLKVGTTYKFTDGATGKKLIAKFISQYDDADDAYLFAEFRKLAALSGEPEIGTVYFVATGEIADSSKSCYIMDFIEGDSLQSYLDMREHIAYDVLLYFTMQLASGLEKAHNFGIFHNDLHNENIMINNLGYLKLIDFLWYEYKDADGDGDLADFKRIMNEFYLKCSEVDKPRFKVIENYCEKISTFKGLKKEIEMLDEISFELGMLNDKQRRILSRLFGHVIDNTLQMSINSSLFDIPEKIISKLDEEEKKQQLGVNGDKSSSVNWFVIQSKINPYLTHLIYMSLHSLKQIGLIDYDYQILSSVGVVLTGPFKYNFTITVTSKLLRWKRANELLLFVDEETKEIEELIVW